MHPNVTHKPTVHIRVMGDNIAKGVPQNSGENGAGKRKILRSWLGHQRRYADSGQDIAAEVLGAKRANS